MKITRLELKNFRTFGHVVLEQLPNMLVFVSPNGRGKSSILEAIAGAHDLVVPYHQDNYEFREAYQQQHLAIWPPHLSPPVKFGEHRAEINLEVEATDSEIGFLAASGINDTKGTASFVIEGGNHVTKQSTNETIKRLFQYHNPTEGIGFIDYVRPIRFYLNQKIGDFAGDLSDNRIRQVFMEFHQPINRHEKFSSLKSYIVSRQLDDYSHYQATKENRDSLEIFRNVFNYFFSPKQFIGYQSSREGSEPEIVVDSPFGSHDINSLSDGEKEMLHILAHFFRFRHLSNIVLWDTPELHLNAALESRLYYAIQKISPLNQTWIATHSLEFINAVPLNSIFVIQQDGNSVSIQRPSGNERRSRIAMYQELGAQVGLQLVSSLVVFVEGKKAQSDKRILDRLVAPFVPGVNFVAGGSCENILALGTRTNLLLNEACTNGDFSAIVDRDYRSDEELATVAGNYNGRVFIWNVHEIENLFLDKAILFATLKFLDVLPNEETEDTIHARLKECAIELREWIAADWLAWDLEKKFQPPDRRISGEDPMKSLREYTTKLKARTDEATNTTSIDEKYRERLTEIDTLIARNKWQTRLPGKQILAKYLAPYQSISSEQYIKAAVSTILEKEIKVTEIDRLKTSLLQMRPGVR